MIVLNKEKKEPLYIQIYNQIRDEILSGTLSEGTVLMGSRKLAQTLHVSRNTVDGAYSQLLAEGYISSKKGIGYIVTKLPKMDFSANSKFHSSTSKFLASTSDKRLFATETIFSEYSTSKTKRDFSSSKDSNIIYDLTNGSHTSDLFPKNLWRKYTLECLDRLEQEEIISYNLDKQGELYLRQTLLSYLERIRGVHCNAAQIIITAGLQQSLDILCKLFQDKEKSVLMEEPGYAKARAVFTSNNYSIHSVPIDKDGLLTSALPDKTQACAIYSTPSHQFPTGVTMPIARRYELLHWAQKSNTYIIEDDHDSELRYYAKPIPSLQSIDIKQNVIYLGTFSKALSPSIRMGYMILPPQLLEQYLDKFANYNSTVPLLNQYVVARLIETGQYDRHVRRMNHIFRQRLECFSENLFKDFSNIKVSSNGSGQYFLLEFTPDANQDELIALASKQGVKVYSTMQFWRDKAACPPNTLFLGFSKIDIKDIPDCADRLKKAWKNWI